MSCSGYAVKHLNAERGKLEVARERDRERWEKKWSDEHQENLAAREADRVVREKFTGAITELAKAIKTPEP
jgi:hypothetical protein